VNKIDRTGEKKIMKNGLEAESMAEMLADMKRGIKHTQEKLDMIVALLCEVFHVMAEEKESSIQENVN